MYFILLLFIVGCEIEQFKVTDKFLQPNSNECVYILRYSRDSRIYHLAATYECDQYDVNDKLSYCDSLDLAESVNCFNSENLTFR